MPLRNYVEEQFRYQNRNINQELKIDHVHIGIECSENLTGSCEVSKNEAVQT